jgi:hypothetical protein
LLYGTKRAKPGASELSGNDVEATNAALETVLERQMRRRGLARMPDALAFVHDGQIVRLEIGESVYRGPIVTVHDSSERPHQFRSLEGQFDWDAIAACIVVVAARKRADRAGSRRAPTPRSDAPFSIQPSTDPGRMRVNLSNMELDPVAAMQLYVLLRQAGAVA